MGPEPALGSDGNAWAKESTLAMSKIGIRNTALTTHLPNSQMRVFAPTDAGGSLPNARFGGEMHKHVLASGALNEPVPFSPVEPLHCTLLSHKKAPFAHREEFILPAPAKLRCSGAPPQRREEQGRVTACGRLCSKRSKLRLRHRKKLRREARSA